MSTSTAPEPRDWRKIALYGVAIAMMAVSIKGQVESTESRMGFFAYVFAVANDVGAIIAVDALFSAEPKSSIRKWAWFAIVLAAGMGATLNIWHVSADAVMGADGQMHYPQLPQKLAYMVGGEPIALTLVLFHLVGLVTSAKRRSARQAADQQQTAVGSAPDRQATHVIVTPPAPNRQLDQQRPTDSAVGRDQQPALAVGPTAPTGAPTARTDSAGTGTGTGTQPRKPVAEPAPHPSAARRTSERGGSGRPPLRMAPSLRPAWMTTDLLDRVVDAMRAARAAGETYGAPRLKTEHPQDGLGQKMTRHKADALLAHIAKHKLLEAAS